MDYENPLDHLIHRFQHRWETNPQFRAAMSGVLGLSLIIFLCVGVVGVNAAATRVLGAVGIGGTGGGSQQNLSPGGQIVNGNWTFYTPTVASWTSGGTPGSNPIPNSQTPAASPTPTATPPDAPTKTPCQGNCGGGGGPRGTVSATWSPPTWSNGDTTRSITFTTSSPNVQINAFVFMPSNNQNPILSATDGSPCPSGGYCSPRATGAAGTVTWPLGQRPQGLPSCGAGQQVKVQYSANFGGQVNGNDLHIPCA
jgi:hypothetical protein